MSTRQRPGLAVIAGLVLAAGGCGGDAAARTESAAAAGARAPRQIIVALDLSGSQTDARRVEAQRTLDEVIADLGYGDRIVLLQVHQRAVAEDGAVRWQDTVPAPRHAAPTTLDRERLDQVRSAARRVAARIFAQEHAGRLQTTDLLSTLHIAGEYVRDADRRPTTLVILSDMLQSTSDMDMERPGGVPPAHWIERQHQAGLLPRLGRTCVAVVGADASTQRGAAVRAFWKGYFEAAGADLRDENYRFLAAGSVTRGCG